MNITVTNLLILINVFMFMQYDVISIYLNKYRIFSPKMIVENHDFIRLIIPHICHVSFGHLFINMLSFHRIGHIMEVILKNRYIYIILFTGLLSCLIHTLIGLIGVYVYNDYGVYLTGGLGFSSIIFGLRYIYFSRLNTTINMLGFDMHSSYATWIELFLAKILMPNTSFIGHLSGIFAGMLINNNL